MSGPATPTGAVAGLARLVAGMEVVDLSQPYAEDMPHATFHNRYFHNLWDSHATGSAAASYQLVLNEHTGTHLDATAHFLPASHPAAADIDTVPLSTVIGRAVTVDLADLPGLDAGTEVTAEQLLRAEQHLGVRFGSGDLVLVRFGWDRFWRPRTESRGYATAFPGLDRGAGQLLVDRGVAVVGSDTMSIDGTAARDAPCHRLLLGEGVLLAENLTNLHRVVGESVAFLAPLKITAGTGAPVRAFALV